MNRVGLLVTLLAAVSAARAYPHDFEVLPGFPHAAPNAYTLVGAALPDGRLVVWNGDTVFVQQAAHIATFNPIATGYLGDPAFILYEASRNSVLLGAGFSGDIYRLDLNAPADYTPAALVINTPHYSALFLDEDLLLIDAGKPGFAGSELLILELGSKDLLSTGAAADLAGPRAVVRAQSNAGTAQQDIIVDKPPFTYSASLALDTQNNIVFAFSAFGSPEELRYFTAGELLQAYNTNTPLDWSSDGTLIGSSGQFKSGGVAAVLPDGHLLMPGSGGVQLVDPSLGNPSAAAVADTFVPAGTSEFYGAMFNEVTGQFLLVDTATNVYALAGVFQEMPIGSALALTALTAALCLAARRRLA